jgi:hypothetical protein
MMNRQLLKRLEALESRKRDDYKPPAKPPLGWYFAGSFSGKYDPVASPFENFYRAIGCERPSDFHALTAEQVQERLDQVLAWIFKRRKIDSPEKLEALVRKMQKPGTAYSASARLIQ